MIGYPLDEPLALLAQGLALLPTLPMAGSVDEATGGEGSVRSGANGLDLSSAYQ